MNLAKYQDQMCQYLLGELTPDAPTIPGLIRDPAIAKALPHLRLQVRQELRKQMRQVFPITLRLLSSVEFKRAANAYIQDSPPTSIDPLQFTEQFPTFLEGYNTEEDFPHLADVATLDYGCYQAHQSIDIDSMSRKDFANYPPEKLTQQKIQLHPACFWMTSPYAIYDIWRSFKGKLPVKVDHLLNSQEVLIIRPMDEVEVHRVDAGFIVTLDTLDAGETLDKALLQGGLADPNFNPVGAIQFLIQNGLIASVY